MSKYIDADELQEKFMQMARAEWSKPTVLNDGNAFSEAADVVNKFPAVVTRYIDADRLINDLLKSTPIDWENYVVNVQEVRHGHWTTGRVRGSLTDICSVCGCDSGTIYHYDYCPNCGAKMVNEDDDTD